MSKTFFVSQPMNGLSDEQVLVEAVDVLRQRAEEEQKRNGT